MRRVLLTAPLVALGLTGMAFASVVVSNVYVLKGSTSPVKSGTAAHPKPTGIRLAYTVSTVPKDERPNVIRTIVLSIAGVQSHTNDFPTCSVSRLNGKGPTACPKGSLVGTGFLLTTIGPAEPQSGKLPATCRVELSVYNGGGGSQSYYNYENPARHGVIPECPTAMPVAFSAGIKEVGTTNVQTITVPFAVRHPGGNSAIDAALTHAQLTVPVKTRTIKDKIVGYAESIQCPANHKRRVSVKFTLENGTSHTETAKLACS